MTEHEIRELVRTVLSALGRGPDVAPPMLEAGDPLGRFRAATAQANVTFLEREGTPTEIGRLLDRDALPMVLWGPVRAGVIHRRDDRLVLSIPGAAPRPLDETASAEEAIAHIGGPTLLLVPVDAAPSVSGEDEAHPTPTERLWQLLVRERRDIWLVYLYATLTGLISLTLPLGVQAITGLVSGGLFVQPVVLLILFVIVGTLVAGALQVMQLSVVEILQQRIFARLAFEFSFHLPRIRLESVLGEHLPEVMNRFFETVAIQKSLAKLLTDASTALLQVLFGLLLLTFYHPLFAAFAAVLLVVLTIIFRLSGPRGISTARGESTEKYQTAHWLQEVARSITAFKFGGHAAFAVSRMDRHVTAYLHQRKSHWSVLVQQALSVVVFKTIVVGGLLILGSLLVIDRQITLGQFVASEIVVVLVMAGIEKLILSIATVYDALIAVEKAGHITDLPLERAGGRLLPERGAATGMTLRVEDLSYRYPGAGHDAITELTFTIGAGERVVIMGADGSGQSTLLRVLSGLYHDYTGALTFDGVPARDLDLGALRADIGQLLSATDLFEGTVAENVQVGRPTLGTGEVTAALEAVDAMHWLGAESEGLRTMLASGGSGLPAHMIHRLLLAQAIVGRPRLLVLDDFFQNLEAETRDRFVEVLMGRTSSWTVVAISHDPAFLEAADRVLVLDEGRLVASGPFRELRGTPVVRALLGDGPGVR